MQESLWILRTACVPCFRCGVALVWIIQNVYDNNDRRAWLCQDHGGSVGKVPPESEHTVSLCIVSHCDAADGAQAVAGGDLFSIAHVHGQAFHGSVLQRKEVRMEQLQRQTQYAYMGPFLVATPKNARGERQNSWSGVNCNLAIESGSE
jgi:hypothetical protein